MDKSIIPIIEAKIDATIKKVDVLQITVDRSIEQQNGDMSRITDLEIQMGKVLAVLEGIRDDLAGNHKRVINEVKDNLQPIPDVVSDAVSEAVKKKKGLFK
jgi:hypothetical protein